MGACASLRKVDFQRPPRWRRFLKKLATVLAALLLVALLASFAFQQWTDADFVAHHPAPGSFVEVDGRRVHYQVSGEGKITFVLEAGLGDYSAGWGNLESRLAGIERVFVYDRAGLGWSEKSAQPRTVEQIVTELHRTLAEAHIPKPYILVGHSFGGLIQTRYAMRYPDEVAGLLLIDPSHPDQMARLPSPPAAAFFFMKQLSWMAPLGIPQLMRRSSDPARNQTSYFQTSGAEMREFVKSASAASKTPINLGRIPIYVLTAEEIRFSNKSEAENARIAGIWRALHEELVAASTSPIRKHIVVAGASHQIHRSHPEVLINAARELVERLGSEKPYSGSE